MVIWVAISKVKVTVEPLLYDHVKVKEIGEVLS